MEPIVYKKDAFPANVAHNGYIAFKVGWNDGNRKFNVFEQRSFGWRCNNTTSGAYDTFADAYAAAERAAHRLANASCIVALLDKEDNARHLLDLWGLSSAQKEELLSYVPEHGSSLADPEELIAPPTTISTVGDLRRALEHIPDDALLNIGTADLGFEVSKVKYDGISAALESKELEEDLAERSRNVQAPDELVVRLAHYAGEMEAKGQVEPLDWDDLCSAIQTTISEYYDNPSETNPFVIEEIAEKTFKERFPPEPGKAPWDRSSFHLPDGSYISAQHFEGDVAAHDKDQRTWQSIDIARYTPDGRLLDALCTVDYEDTLGLRSLVYANNNLEEPLYAHKHELSPIPAVALDAIIKGAQERRDAAPHSRQQEGVKTKDNEIER